MKRIITMPTWAFIMALVMIFCAPMIVFAQEVVAPVTDLDFLGKLLQFFGEYKSMTSLALAAGAVQLLILFFNAPISGKIFSKLDAQLKLIIVTALSIVAGLIAQKIAGISFGDAFWSAANLAAVQVFLHQIYLKFFSKKV